MNDRHELNQPFNKQHNMKQRLIITQKQKQNHVTKST